MGHGEGQLRDDRRNQKVTQSIRPDKLAWDSRGGAQVVDHGIGATLRLPGHQEQLIELALASGKKVGPAPTVLLSPLRFPRAKLEKTVEWSPRRLCR